MALLDNGKGAAAAVALAAVAGLVVGTNRDKVVELLSPPVRWVGKTAAAVSGAVKGAFSNPPQLIGRTASAVGGVLGKPANAVSGAFRSVLRKKEALQDKVAEARV